MTLVWKTEKNEKYYRIDNPHFESVTPFLVYIQIRIRVTYATCLSKIFLMMNMISAQRVGKVYYLLKK